MHQQANAAALLVATLLLAGCAYSYQARTYTPTSFLGSSASLLHKGKKGEDPLLVYRRAATDWRSYDKMIIDPIEIWTTDPSASNADRWADIQNWQSSSRTLTAGSQRHTRS